jgi:hypothetical protein
MSSCCGVERRKTGLRLAQPMWCRLLEDRRGLRRMNRYLVAADRDLASRDRVDLTDTQEHGSFQNEPVAEMRNSQAIEKALKAEVRLQRLVVIARAFGSIQQPSCYRRISEVINK